MSKPNPVHYTAKYDSELILSANLTSRWIINRRGDMLVEIKLPHFFWAKFEWVHEDSIITMNGEYTQR